MIFFENDIIKQDKKIKNGLDIVSNINMGSKLGAELASFVKTDEEFAKYNKYIK